ncbi:MAG: hypothetical protein ACUVSF_03650 [Anaerolineae bacterium]
MRSGKTWWLFVTVLTLGTLWLSTSLCSAQSPWPPPSPVRVVTATPAAQEQHSSQPAGSTSSWVAEISPGNPSSDQPSAQPEPTPLPEVTLFTVLTPARCLILGFVGGVVFIIVYGLQMALVRRLR